ncbi:DJ-1/PfpI family protein [uncultured Paraglaciecola sp.]|uniref:DJ-1/PfpI family protein n=1 Tax=uncultured Paraglaciecola sp. TaxID=1765024 RepID=UPI0030D764E2|tara:strand:- start:3731 stop:4375 length:645 start_codon:yes stop_codon:yes gene_type:complete
MIEKNQAFNIGIYLYKNAEVLDFAGPFEVFSTANRLHNTTQQFNVFLIGESALPILARGGFCITPKYSIYNHPALELLVVVGGIHTEEMQKAHIIHWLQQQRQKVAIIASVCTGAFILAQAGILNNHQATTHWSDIQDFKQKFPTIPIIENVSWVDNQNVITSAGITAGIDMSLYLLSKFCSLQLALSTAKQMQFQWSNIGFHGLTQENQDATT